MFFTNLLFSQKTVGIREDGETVVISEGTWKIVEQNYDLMLENEKKYLGRNMSLWEEGAWREDLSHIYIMNPDGEVVALNELKEQNNIDLFYPGAGDFLWSVYFELVDFELDGINELVLRSSYRMASGSRGEMDIYTPVSSNSKTYSRVKSLKSHGGTQYGFNSDNTIYSRDGDVFYMFGQFCGNNCCEPYVQLVYRYGELFHQKKSFSKNTEYLNTMTSIKNEIDWKRLKGVEKKDGSINYYFFNDDGTYDTFDSVLCNWYRPLIQNIMAYHYNSMKVGTYPNERVNLQNTRKIFYNIYQAGDVDEKWRELTGLLNNYSYKKL